KTPGTGPALLNHPTSLFYEDATDRLFVSDTGNNRVVVFDVNPKQLRTGMSASMVIGQPDLNAVQAGKGPDRLNRPGRLVHDPVHQRLFVGDSGNRRLLVFDSAAARMKSGETASFVMGQPDFVTTGSRTSMKALAPGAVYLDSVRQRLYATEQNRTLVFDVDPARMKNNADAIAVLLQQDFNSPEARVSRTRETWGRGFL